MKRIVLSLVFIPLYANTTNKIEYRLANDTIKNVTSLSEVLKKQGKTSKANAKIKMVELEHGLKGVCKKGESKYAEIAAYKASKALGLTLVPPTIMRTIDGIEGSLQHYIASSVDLLNTKGSQSFKKLNPKDKSDMKIFYYVFGQWDTHQGNQIISDKGCLSLIDNEGMNRRVYNKYGDYPFIEKGENSTLPSIKTDTFPYDKAITIRPHSYHQLDTLFSPYINSKQIKVLWEKRKSITYVIWQDTLWIYMNKHPLRTKTKYYYASTLEKLKQLDRAKLAAIWSEGLPTDPTYYEKIITLTLERRDELLEAAYASGKILIHDPLAKA